MPSNALFGVDSDTIVPNGEKMLRGYVMVGIGAGGAYDSGNTIFDLSNYFKSTTEPTVIVGAASGYTFEFTGTAASGLLTAYFIDSTNINGIATNMALIEVTNAVNIATNSKFIAFGQAY